MGVALTVSALAKRTGVPSRTIRYWEQRELLPRAERSPAGYRLFGPDGIHYVDFIQKAKSIGLTLSEITTVLALSRAGRNPCPEVVGWIAHKSEAIEQQIRLLRRLHARLKTVRRAWSKRSGSNCFKAAELCCLIEDLRSPTKNGGKQNEKALPVVGFRVRRRLC